VERNFVISNVRQGLTGVAVIEGVEYPNQRFTVTVPYAWSSYAEMYETVGHLLEARGRPRKPLR
jgi:hypothetical protein